MLQIEINSQLWRNKSFLSFCIRFTANCLERAFYKFNMLYLHKERSVILRSRLLFQPQSQIKVLFLMFKNNECSEDSCIGLADFFLFFFFQEKVVKY